MCNALIIVVMCYCCNATESITSCGPKTALMPTKPLGAAKTLKTPVRFSDEEPDQYQKRREEIALAVAVHGAKTSPGGGKMSTKPQDTKARGFGFLGEWNNLDPRVDPKKAAIKAGREVDFFKALNDKFNEREHNEPKLVPEWLLHDQEAQVGSLMRTNDKLREELAETETKNEVLQKSLDETRADLETTRALLDKALADLAATGADVATSDETPDDGCCQCEICYEPVEKGAFVCGCGIRICSACVAESTDGGIYTCPEVCGHVRAMAADETSAAVESTPSAITADSNADVPEPPRVVDEAAPEEQQVAPSDVATSHETANDGCCQCEICYEPVEKSAFVCGCGIRVCSACVAESTDGGVYACPEGCGHVREITADETSAAAESNLNAITADSNANADVPELPRVVDEAAPEEQALPCDGASCPVVREMAADEISAAAESTSSAITADSNANADVPELSRGADERAAPEEQVAPSCCANDTRRECYSSCAVDESLKKAPSVARPAAVFADDYESALTHSRVTYHEWGTRVPVSFSEDFAFALTETRVRVNVWPTPVLSSASRPRVSLTTVPS